MSLDLTLAFFENGTESGVPWERFSEALEANRGVFDRGIIRFGDTSICEASIKRTTALFRGGIFSHFCGMPFFSFIFDLLQTGNGAIIWEDNPTGMAFATSGVPAHLPEGWIDMFAIAPQLRSPADVQAAIHYIEPPG